MSLNLLPPMMIALGVILAKLIQPDTKPGLAGKPLERY